MQLIGGEFAVYFGAPATSATIGSLAEDGRVGSTEAKAAGNMVESVQLNSPGGRLAEGAKLGA